MVRGRIIVARLTCVSNGNVSLEWPSRPEALISLCTPDENLSSTRTFPRWSFLTSKCLQSGSTSPSCPFPLPVSRGLKGLHCVTGQMFPWTPLLSVSIDYHFSCERSVSDELKLKTEKTNEGHTGTSRGIGETRNQRSRRFTRIVILDKVSTLSTCEFYPIQK